MPSTQKALLLKQKYAELVVDEVEIYEPGPGEILIKIQAAALNPIDWKIHKWGVFIDNFPAILGTDIAGDVKKVGPGVEDFEVGDRVFCQGRFLNRNAGFQQYAIAESSLMAKIPSSFSYDEVVTIPVALTAAYVGLYHDNPHGLGFPKPVLGETRCAGIPLIIFGGATAVGQSTISLANLSGFSPIITTASLKNASFLQRLGATHVLDRNLPTESLAVEIAKITSEPIQYIYDAVSLKPTEQSGLDLLAPGGKLAVVQTPEVTAPPGKSIVRIMGILLDHNSDILKDLYHNKVADFLEQGVIKPNRVEVIPGGLMGVPGGLMRMEADQVSRQKLVIHPQSS